MGQFFIYVNLVVLYGIAISNFTYINTIASGLRSLLTALATAYETKSIVNDTCQTVWIIHKPLDLLILNIYFILIYIWILISKTNQLGNHQIS